MTEITVLSESSHHCRIPQYHLRRKAAHTRGPLLSVVSVFFRPALLKPEIELSKADRSPLPLDGALVETGGGGGGAGIFGGGGGGGAGKKED